MAKGVLAAALLIASLSTVSGLVLSRERLTELLREDFSSGGLTSDPARVVEDWVECSLLTMEYIRHDNILDAIDTSWMRPTHHTCEELKALVAGPPYTLELAPPSHYINYAFGARHFEAILLSVLSIMTAKTLCLMLSYVSVVCLFLGGWRNSPPVTLAVLLPIGLFLLFAFEQHRYGDSLMWAPAFFVGFFTLAVFLAARDRFNDRANRIGLFCFLALILTFLDTMQGSLPVLLSLTIVLNHFFYVSRGTYPTLKAYFVATLVGLSTIFLCFITSFIVYTVVRLLILSHVIAYPVWHSFVTDLGSRMGDVVPEVGTVHLSEVVQKLWSERSQMTGNDFATWLFWASGLAWLCAISMLIFLVPRRIGNAALMVSVDVFVLTVASLGILSWFVIFPNHSYIHAWFMVRMMALPESYGFVAAIIVIQRSFQGKTMTRHYASLRCA